MENTRNGSWGLGPPMVAYAWLWLASEPSSHEFYALLLGISLGVLDTPQGSLWLDPPISAYFWKVSLAHVFCTYHSYFPKYLLDVTSSSMENLRIAHGGQALLWSLMLGCDWQAWASSRLVCSTRCIRHYYDFRYGGHATVFVGARPSDLRLCFEIEPWCVSLHLLSLIRVYEY